MPTMLALLALAPLLSLTPAHGEGRALLSSSAGQPTVIYMNRSGGTYTPGVDDSRTNTSSLPNSTSTVNALTCDATVWNDVMTCVREQYAAFNVSVTDVDPGSASHIECVAAGLPTELGLPAGTLNVAPFHCAGTPNAIVFAFGNAIGCDARRICELSAQEIAHAFSLDHEFLCADTMTYLTGCGNKSFQDVSADCGENASRACLCGGTQQNSFQLLLAALGPSPSPSPTQTPSPTPTPGSPDNGGGSGCKCGIAAHATPGASAPFLALLALAGFALLRRVYFGASAGGGSEKSSRKSQLW